MSLNEKHKAFRLVAAIAAMISLASLPGLFTGCLDPCGSCSAESPSKFQPLTASMIQARFSHSATLLSNDKVLIAGGASNVAIHNSAELYDPTTGDFERVGSMSQSRVFHTATLLANGNVLIAGGRAGSVLNTAEIYEPGSQTFTGTQNMTAYRTAHTATLLNSGQVLITGGSEALTQPFLFDSGALNSAELYNPLDGSFTAIQNMTVTRSEHTATLLGDGSVLITGGMDDKGKALTTAELYDPSTGTFTPTIGKMQAARRNHAAALISGCAGGGSPNGEVLISGGQGKDGSALASAELYDPDTKTFTPTGLFTPSMGVKGRFYHTATSFGDCKVLIAGGNPNEDAEIYDASMETFGPILSNPDNIATGAANAAVVLVTGPQSGQVLVTGGGEPPDPKRNFLSANTTATILDSTGSYTGPLNMTTGRLGHTATVLQDGTVLIAGGEEPTFAVLSSTELYDPTEKTFLPAPPLPVASCNHEATSLAGGTQVLVSGGVDSTFHVTASAVLYAATSTSVTLTPIAEMTTPREGATSSALPNGTVLIAGGTQKAQCRPSPVPSPIGLNSTEIFDPVGQSFSPAANMMDARAFASAAVLTSGSNAGMVLIVGGADASGLVQKTAEIYDPVHGSIPTGSPPHFQYANVPATVLADGTVLLNDGKGHAELYNPSTNGFVVVGLGSQSLFACDFTATLLMDGKVLFGGGFAINTCGTSSLSALPNTEAYTPVTQTFSDFGVMNEARGSQAATLLSSGDVLITGGEGTLITTLSSAELLPFSSQAAAKRSSSVRSRRSAHGSDETLVNGDSITCAVGENSSQGVRLGRRPTERRHDLILAP